MPKKPLLLKIERHFKPVETFSSIYGVLSENTLNKTPRKRSLRNKKNRRSV